MSKLSREDTRSNNPKKILAFTPRLFLLRKKYERKIPWTVPRKINSEKISIWIG